MSIGVPNTVKVKGKTYVATEGTDTVNVGGGFGIGAFDEMDVSYVESTNNISTIVYKKNGTPVNTLTFTYLNAGTANDDLITKIALT